MKQDKKCVRFTYLILLFAVFVLEVAVVMVEFDTGLSLGGTEAKLKIGTAKDTVENKAIETARAATSNLYKNAGCTGGDPTEPVDSVDTDVKAHAVKFNDIKCADTQGQKMFNYFFKDESEDSGHPEGFASKGGVDMYKACMKDAPAGDASEAVFCRGKSQILAFISKYQTYAKMLPIA